MFDGIVENICLALAVFPSVLLRAKHYSLASLHSVYAVYHFIKPLHLLKLFSIDVEQVLLYWRISTNTHHYHTGFLILIPLPIDFL